MTSNSVVSDSSILIHLSRMGELKLLKEIFGKIIVPKAVYKECTVENKAGSEEIRNSEWIEVREIEDQNLKKVLRTLLDEGEAEAITLALEIDADLVLLDETEARRIAKNLGLKVTGTVGTLLKAKKLGLIDDLKKEIELLRETGFWISDDLVRKILSEEGESCKP